MTNQKSVDQELQFSTLAACKYMHTLITRNPAS